MVGPLEAVRESRLLDRSEKRTRWVLTGSGLPRAEARWSHRKEYDVSPVVTDDPQVARLADAIAQRVGQQRYQVWFSNSTRLDLKHDALEIVVPNDFISEWIGTHYVRPIQEAASEVLGCSMPVRFSVVPQLFEQEPNVDAREPTVNGNGKSGGNRHAAKDLSTRQASRQATARPSVATETPDSRLRKVLSEIEPVNGHAPAAHVLQRPRLRHDLDSFVVGSGNQMAYNAAVYVAEFPGSQYNPLFIHGGCGLGKTHLLQGLCRRFADHHPTKRWMYLTGEDFTNEFLASMRGNKTDAFRRKMRELDLLVIDDVHFLGGKRATQEEFLHTFNAIEASGRQVVMASDNHPKLIEEFGESLINRFVSGMVVRIDPPNHATRCEILRRMADRARLTLPDDVIGWIARRVTQNVRELEGAITRIGAHVQLTGRLPTVEMAQQALGDLDRHLVNPVRPESIVGSVCEYFGLEPRDLMSGRRQRTISLARSVAMFLVRRTSKLSFPEIASRMGKRNHSTVISACRRIERAVERNEKLVWTSNIGEREEEAGELIQRLEEHSRSISSIA